MNHTEDPEVPGALKSCPFCGAVNVEAVVAELDPPSFMVECRECEAGGPPAETRIESAGLWNYRP